MSIANDGGAAFPRQYAQGSISQTGMSLRDWFAGQALSIVYMRFQTSADPDPQDLAAQAYFIADAMIAAREIGGAK